jgi:CRP-like cAMP-binding protein
MLFKEVVATSLEPSEPNLRDIGHQLERAALENSLAWPHPAPPNPPAIDTHSVGNQSASDWCAFRHFQKGEQLTLDPQLFWQIEAGCVKSMTWDEAGDVVCLGLWGEGDVVGAPLTQLAPYQLECLSEVKARSVLVSGNYLQQLIAHHSRQIESLLNIVHCRRISDRLIKALTWLVQKFGKRTREGWLLDFWLTHQTLAEMTGTTRVTVTRLLHELEQEGRIIRQSRHRILLCRLG